MDSDLRAPHLEGNGVGGNPKFVREVRGALMASEEGLYLIVGLLLLTAAVFVVIGTVSGLVTAVRHGTGAVDTGVVVLDRILLALIVAELLHTLRWVVLRGEIVVEPFLFIGLIAVVRRILILTAEFEHQAPSGRAFTNQLLEFGLLGTLVLAFAVAIHLVRRSQFSVRIATPSGKMDGSAQDRKAEPLPSEA
jgi:uncharacterized membrane protein (DUF373 family)